MIQLALLTCILLTAGALRFYAIGQQCFWLDELLSLEASTGRGQTDQALPRDEVIHPPRLTKLDSAPPAWKVWTTLEKDSHPPLYYLLLRFWRTVVGDGEVAIRVMSLLWSVAAVALTYLVGHRLAGPRAALIASSFIAISPLQILYAQEARNYAMLCAATLLAAWTYLRAEEMPSPARLIALGSALLLSMLTHYLAAPVLAAIAVYAMFRHRGKSLLKLAAPFAAAAIVYAIIWGPFVLAQRDAFRRNREGSADIAAAGSVTRTLIRLGCEPLRQIAGTSFESSRFAPLFAILIACAIIAILIAYRKKPPVLFAIIYLAAPLLFLGTCDILAGAATLTFPRYTVVCAPGLFLLLGCLIAETRTLRVRFAIAPTIVAAATYSLISFPLSYRPWKSDWRLLRRCSEP